MFAKFLNSAENLGIIKSVGKFDSFPTLLTVLICSLYTAVERGYLFLFFYGLGYFLDLFASSDNTLRKKQTAPEQDRYKDYQQEIPR